MTFLPLRRSHSLRLLFSGLLCLGLLGSPRPASAAHPFTKGFQGVVQSVDRASKTIELRASSKGTLLKLVWNEGTHFLADGNRTTVDALQAGMQVKVKYHEVLFGHDYISTIEWHSAAPGKTTPPTSNTH